MLEKIAELLVLHLVYVVIVKDELRGKGVGRKLMESLDEIAKNRQCAYAILVSSAHRKAAHKFYENAGFIDSVVGFRKVY